MSNIIYLESNPYQVRAAVEEDGSLAELYGTEMPFYMPATSTTTRAILPLGMSRKNPKKNSFRIFVRWCMWARILWCR